MCGKTGTVQNSARINGRDVPQQDHSFFGAFAPRDNPRIAIAVLCENAGQGAWAAAPIASFLVEKYLKDSIRGKERQDKMEEITKKTIIPYVMRLAMNKRDSLKQVKENQLLIQQKMSKEAGDSADTEEGSDQEIKPAVPKPSKNAAPKPKNTSVAILNSDEKKNRKSTRA
jgi:penicillin-binding protein 2